MAFMGETTDVGVAELLSVLARRGHTGRLHINTSGEEVQVTLNGGKVTQVSSSHHSLRIGRVLVRMGVLQESDLNEAVREQIGMPTAKPLGQILTSSGLLTQNDLALAAEEQATDALSRVFGTHEGTFFFTGLAAEHARPGLMSLNAEGIVLEASRRADEIEALRGMMPASDAVLVPNRSSVSSREQLAEYEQRVIGMIETKPSTVSDLIARMLDDERAILRAIVSLHERGHIEMQLSSGDVRGNPGAVTIAPRTADDVRALIESDAASDRRDWIPGIADVRAAQPAGAETVALATRVARDVVGAFNAGLPLLAFAHFTDAYFRRIASDAVEELEMLQRLAEPLAEEQQQTFIDLRDVRMLPDGRVSGIAVTCMPGSEPTRKVLIFVKASNRCRVDAILEPEHARNRSTQTTMLSAPGLFSDNRRALRLSL